MIGVLLFSILYVVISVDSTLKKMRYKEENNIKISTRNKFYASITIKILIHYAQILSLLQTFQLGITSTMSQGSMIFSNPMTTFSGVIDCFI